MKTRKTRKLMSFILTAVMAVMMMTAVVSAATTYDPIPGTTTTFDKYLIMPADANVPDVEFTFTIAGGTEVNGDATNLAVYSGADTDKATALPTIGSATFAPGDTTYTSVQTGDASVTLNTGEKYAVQVVTVDFTGVNFKEPGVYRYTITETASTVSGIIYDNVPKTLDVYVEDAGDGTLRVGNGTSEGYVLYNSVISTAPSKTTTDVSANKASGFVNRYETFDLTVGKSVAGNQASRDEYFQFTINITGALPNTTYNVDLSDADATTAVNGINTTANSNAASFTTDASGAATITYWLQHDQSIVIQGLTKNAKYSVSENATTIANEGYVATATVTSDSDDDQTVSMPAVTDTSTGITDDTIIAYTNTKEGVIPTGIIISVAGLLVVGIIAVIGFVFFGIRSKKRYDEE